MPSVGELADKEAQLELEGQLAFQFLVSFNCRLNVKKQGVADIS